MITLLRSSSGWLVLALAGGLTAQTADSTTLNLTTVTYNHAFTAADLDADIFEPNGQPIRPSAITFDSLNRLMILDTFASRPADEPDGNGSNLNQIWTIDNSSPDGQTNPPLRLPSGPITEGKSISPTMFFQGKGAWLNWGNNVLHWPSWSPKNESLPPQTLWQASRLDADASGSGLTGPAVGPDGKFYFAMGDAGIQLTGPDDSALPNSKTGIVFRSDPDGGNLETMAIGLCAPQALCFDANGNLWVVDQLPADPNSRLLQIVEGGDYGWHRGLLYARDDTISINSGYTLPQAGDLPGGTTAAIFHPGTGLTPNYWDRMLVSHRSGSRQNSGILSVALSPTGAGFIATSGRELLRGSGPSDLQFGPDSRLYLVDEGFAPIGSDLTGRRILVLDQESPTQAELKVREDVGSLLSGGVEDLTLFDLSRRLAHPDYRVRLAAQFGFAARPQTALPVLRQIVIDTSIPLRSRLHALWAMGQLADAVPEAMNDLPRLMVDPEPEMRAQAARLAGDAKRFEFQSFLISRLKDDTPRVAFFAAQSLGKLGRPETATALFDLLRRNREEDIWITHAVVTALSRINATDVVRLSIHDPSPAVRRGGLYVYRRWKDPAVAEFLTDSDPTIVRAAARAINDESIITALPSLADILLSSPLDDAALVSRSLNAHFRLGGPLHATALAEFAALPYVPASLRAEALEKLGQWLAPPERDSISGRLRPVGERDPNDSREAMMSFISALNGTAPEAVQVATLEAVGNLKMQGVGHALWDIVYQANNALPTRIAALRALEQVDDLRLEVAAQTAGRSLNPSLRIAALPILARRPAGVSLPTLQFAVDHGTPDERRTAFKILAAMNDERAEELLLRSLTQLSADGDPPAWRADLLDAASNLASPALQAKLTELEQAWRDAPSPIEPYRGTLSGGNALVGQNLFMSHAAMRCVHCHDNEAEGPAAGPSWQTIAKSRTPAEVLMAIVTHAAIDSGSDSLAPPSSQLTQLPRVQLRDLMAFLTQIPEPPLLMERRNLTMAKSRSAD